MSRPADPGLRRLHHGRIKPMHWKPRKPGRITALLRAYREFHGATFEDDVAIVMMLIGVVVFTVLALPL